MKDEREEVKAANHPLFPMFLKELVACLCADNRVTVGNGAPGAGARREVTITGVF